MEDTTVAFKRIVVEFPSKGANVIQCECDSRKDWRLAGIAIVFNNGWQTTLVFEQEVIEEPPKPLQVFENSAWTPEPEDGDSEPNDNDFWPGGAR